MIEATFNAVTPTPIVAEFDAIIPREKAIPVANKSVSITENGEYKVQADDNTVMTEVGIEVDIPYKTRYVEFKDETFAALVGEKMGYGVGLTDEQVREVTTIPDSFAARNTDINDISDLTRFSKLTNIGTNAFYRCSGLASIEIPNSVTSIERSAFELNNSFITNLSIPDSVVFISNRAFSYFFKLKTVILSKNVEILGEQFFDQCNELESVTVSDIEAIQYSMIFPQTLVSLGNYSLRMPKIKTAYFLSKTPPEIGTNTFSSTKITVIYVPDEAKLAYQTATNWSEQSDKIFGISESGYKDRFNNYN